MAKDKKLAKKSKPKPKSNNNLNLNLKDKNYNLIKVKYNYLNTIGISIFLNIIITIFTVYVIIYLNNLKNCDCFKKINDKNNANIDYLLIIESLNLAMLIILLINLVSLYMAVDKIKSGGYSIKAKLTLYITLTIYSIIYGFFIYNVYKLSQNIDDKCACTLNPARYLLYVESFLILVYLILSLLGLFLI